MTSHVYAPKADSNHSEIAGWYENAMCLVFDVHELGGFVDLLVRIPTYVGSILQMVEIKTTTGDVTKAQALLHKLWGGYCVAIVRTREDVLAHVKRVQDRYRPGGNHETQNPP